MRINNCGCRECGKAFYAKPSHIKKGGGKFCSRKCAYKFRIQAYSGENNPNYQGKARIRNCAICNKEIKVPLWKIIKSRGKCCSNKCRHIYQIGLTINEKQPAYKGKMAGYVALHLWAKKYLVKPQTCRDCNQPKALQLANVSGKYLRELFDWEWLCGSCHKKKDLLKLKMGEYNGVKDIFEISARGNIGQRKKL